ncbi:MAG TPA: glycoside hydrolase family 78 protein [bacterium]|nr:glycoside hydrolase family 78 protein [bacterium]HPN42785.1 glycoside hydrolase family 78 protein [bacterium]
MKKALLPVLLLVCLTIIIQPLFAKTALTVTQPTCEYKTNPLGIDAAQPRLSWQIQSNERGSIQSAMQIRVAASIKDLKNQPLWDTEKVATDASIQLPYLGPDVQSGQRYYWQVRVWDQKGNVSAWSEPAWWEMGLLKAADWKAAWIQPNLEEDLAKSAPCPMLRKDFQLKGKIRSARAYVTSLGLYELHLNGAQVGDQVLTPGWTSFDTRLQYQTYDVTNMLQTGANAVGVMLGDGWYRGYMGWGDQRNTWGKKLALLLQIQVVYENGEIETIISDASWRAATGPVTTSDIYMGETYDARKEKPGWTNPGYKDQDWAGVSTVDHSKEILIAPVGPPVQKVEEIKPVKIIKTPAGETVFDMGQNMVGWIRLKVEGPAGTTVKLRHAEVLDKEGNFYITNLRAAKQTVEYTLKGQGVEIYEPHFTFQGFRYVAVEGWPGDPALDNLTGVVVHSAFTPTGSFSCSNPLINQLQHNIQWGQKGNFVDVPTDCPQRDERLGWTGDAQAFARTACFNADVAGFYTKWLGDVAADQKPNGAIPHVIPNALDRKNPTSNAAACGWADASVIVPWTVYLCNGDTRILEQQYSSMKKWVEYMRQQAGDNYLWQTGYHFGDWLAFNSESSDYPGATTDKDLLATAFFANSTGLLLQSAKILGYHQDVQDYTGLLDNIKKAFLQEYVTANGRLSSNTQTAYSVALAFDLLPPSLAEKAAARLAEDVKKFGHITTGFLGTPLICHVLSDYGYTDLAYMLLNRLDYPSWLYPITRGATTIWERWDGIKPDGSFQDAGMNSFNHYAYGAIGDWLYRVTAGIEIDPQQPGYKHILIQPQPGGGLSNASANFSSMYGPIQSGWELKQGVMTMTVELPANTTATIALPDAVVDKVTEAGLPLVKAKGISKSEQSGKTVILEAGSGKYVFSYPLQK